MVAYVGMNECTPKAIKWVAESAEPEAQSVKNQNADTGHDGLKWLEMKIGGVVYVALGIELVSRKYQGWIRPLRIIW